MPELPDVEGLRAVMADHARGRPIRRVDVLDAGVLRGAIPTGRVPPRSTWLTGVRDRTDARCPRCGAALARGRVGGRTTVWCPRCQPR